MHVYIITIHIMPDTFGYILETVNSCQKCLFIYSFETKYTELSTNDRQGSLTNTDCQWIVVMKNRRFPVYFRLHYIIFPVIIAPFLLVLSIYMHVYIITIHIMPDTFGYIGLAISATILRGRVLS
jgi:hypothetical protein